MRVMSIGSVYPPHLLGGYEVIWRGVSQELQAQGHPSRVLVTGYVNPNVAPDADDDPDVFRELDWYWRDHAWPRFSLRRRLGLEQHNGAVFDRHVAEFRPDVVAFWAMGGLSLSLIERARRLGLASVFFILDPWPSYGPAQDQWLATWRRLGPLATLAGRLSGVATSVDFDHGRWVFCSASMREQTLADGVVVGANRHVLLSPGVDAVYLGAPAESAAPEWGWRLLYLGRVVEQKGVRTAVEALAHLPEQATLEIVGAGDESYRSELKSRARALGVRERVSFRPPVSQAQTIAAYRAADVVLHPVGWAEPWGLVPLEAMALGRPVVATGQGGSADYLRDGENALLHAPGDAAGLAAAVTRLGADAELRARLVAGGRETAGAHTAAAFNRAAVTELARAAAGPEVPAKFR